MDIERCKLMMDFAIEGFWDWDLITGQAFLSPRYCEMIGYAPEDKVCDAVFLRNIIHPDDHQLVYRIVEEHRQGLRNSSVTELRVITKSGTVCWMDVRGKTVTCDDQGRATRLVGTVVDVTERKLAEIERGQYLNFFTTSSELMCIAGITGYFIKTNPSFSRVLGYTWRELQARPIIEFIHPDDRQATGEEIARQIQGAIVTANFENRYLCKDGSFRWLAWNAYYNDAEKLIFGIARDVTEQKRLAGELSHSKNLLSSIVDNAPYAIFVKDVIDDFRYVLWNKTAESMFGVAAHEVLGKNAHDHWPGSQADKYLSNDREVVVSRTTSDFPKVVSHHFDRGEIYIHVCKIPLIDIHGDVSHIVVICDDITERHRVQSELVKNQKLESLGVLAGGIAHDFNNILTGILGNISYARTLIDESEKAFKILLEAEKATNRASDLAIQLLTFAKGSQPIIKPLSLRNLIEASAAFVLRSTNVSCAIELPDDIRSVMVDEGQINQVFNNIIINASQAMPGGGTITVKAEHVEIAAPNVMAISPGTYAKVSFTDTGCGIPEESQAKIFDPYFTTKTTGSGLGLASAHSIVTKHGGHIGVRSLVDTGTTIEILLPTTTEKFTDMEPAIASMELATKTGYSILVMDDDEIIRDFTSMALTDLGYHVRTCCNGDEAIKLYSSALDCGMPYSVVILDLTVQKGMGGKETARHILDMNPKARLIVSSGYSTDSIMAEYAMYGFCAALVKPYNIEDVSSKISQVLLDRTSQDVFPDAAHSVI